MLVSKPEVKIKEEAGRTLEPYDLATLDFPQEFMGVVSEKLNHRKGEMRDMRQNDSGRFRLGLGKRAFRFANSLSWENVTEAYYWLYQGLHRRCKP